MDIIDRFTQPPNGSVYPTIASDYGGVCPTIAVGSMCHITISIGQGLEVSLDSCGESHSQIGSLLQEEEDASSKLEIVSSSAIVRHL